MEQRTSSIEKGMRMILITVKRNIDFLNAMVLPPLQIRRDFSAVQPFFAIKYDINRTQFIKYGAFKYGASNTVPGNYLP